MSPVVTPSSRVAVAQWLVDSLLPIDTPVAGSVVPPRYEAYARILHPAQGQTGYVSWAEIAQWSGRVYHPAMQFEAIATPVPGAGVSPRPWNGYEPYGGMPSAQAATLAALLRPFTATPETVWYLVWEGHGFLDPSTAPRVHRPGPRAANAFRSYLLYSGGIDDAADLGLNAPFPVVADYWFPEDRAWCVATDVDLFWTYVGATRACVAAILGGSGLEGVPADLDHGLTVESDQIHARPPEH